MPKYLPPALENSLAQFDSIINQQAATLASSPDAKVSVADLCRLFQLRLDLADRLEATKPTPVLTAWVDPAWMAPAAGISDAIRLLDRTRAELEAALEEK